MGIEETKKETKNNILFVVLSLAAVLAMHLIFWHNFAAIKGKAIFLLVDAALALAVLYFCYRAISEVKKGGADNSAYFLCVIIAVIECIWIGSWLHAVV